jgi:hypothetical protein
VYYQSHCTGAVLRQEVSCETNENRHNDSKGKETGRSYYQPQRYLLVKVKDTTTNPVRIGKIGKTKQLQPNRVKHGRCLRK